MLSTQGLHYETMHPFEMTVVGAEDSPFGQINFWSRRISRLSKTFVVSSSPENSNASKNLMSVSGIHMDTKRIVRL